MNSIKTNAARWLLLLGGASALRLVLFVGPMGSDDLNYSAHAWALATGTYRPVPDVFSLRLGYVAPVAALYALFGAGAFSLVLVNLALSLAGIFLAFRIASEYLDERGAWLAAAFLAILPLDVFFATEAHTDLPLAAVTAGSVLCHLQGRRSGRPLHAFGAGLLLGFGHLIKESAFFGLAALAAVGGRPRRKDVWVLAGFAFVVLLETAFYAIVTGDPLFRVHAIRAVQTTVITEAEGCIPGRLGDALTMFLLPWGGGFPFFGLGWLAALGGAILVLARRDRTLFPLVVWLAAILALLMFWPITFRPYRPALRAHPRIFHLAAVPMSILAARLIRGSPRPLGRLAAGALVAAALPSAVLLRADGRRFSEGARLAFRRLPPGLPVVSDPRTTGLFRLYDGYRASRAWRTWDDPPPPAPHVRVVNDRWIALLKNWYGQCPPAWFSGDPAELLEEITIHGRLRWRPLLEGHLVREAPEHVRLLLVRSFR